MTTPLHSTRALQFIFHRLLLMTRAQTRTINAFGMYYQLHSTVGAPFLFLFEPYFEPGFSLKIILRFFVPVQTVKNENQYTANLCGVPDWNETNLHLCSWHRVLALYDNRQFQRVAWRKSKWGHICWWWGSCRIGIGCKGMSDNAISFHNNGNSYNSSLNNK